MSDNADSRIPDYYGITNQIIPHFSALISINRTRAGAVGSLTECWIVVVVLLSIF